MIKLFKLILILKFLLSLTLVNSYSASTTGAATVYKVTMKKVELCTASTGVSSCENAVIIGDTSKEVNIVDAAELSLIHISEPTRQAEISDCVLRV